ncbi:hypothetical protein [Gemmobacter serpentinus]|uniref:hypothetical protein n=1 Tax=Gemmobacter serpentinus TaxID=2652247 RepID=UPI00124BFF69|nr:hypothetical protein [Gemmobacter serpentinus]
MIVDELYGLAVWLNREVAPNLGLYDNLASVLEHNARAAQKSAVAEPLQDLENMLAAMPMEQLSSEQIELLKANGALSYLGKEGLSRFKRIVRSNTFDPVTAWEEARAAYTVVSETVSKLDSMKRALEAANVPVQRPFVIDEGIVTRLHFKDKANIGDVAELKKWSAEWYEIARGLSAAVGEKPEDVRIIGAGTGSLILVLATTVAIASTLAVLALRVNTIAKSVLDVLNGIEDLRHKKVLNKTIEDAMKEQAEAIRASGVAEAVNDVKNQIGKAINKEVEGQLQKSVEKYFAFTEKGGEIDMIAPPKLETDEEAEIARDITQLQDAIESVRLGRSNLQIMLGKDG